MLTHKGTVPIKTERLLLRKIDENDYKDMYKYVVKEEVAKYVTWTPHKSIDETKALCEMWAKECENIDRYNWAIVFDGKVIGNIEVGKIIGETALLGYQTDSAYWNKGIMTEAVKAVIDFLFYEVNVEAVEAAYLSENIGSGRVMRKAGMTEIPYSESKEYKLKGITEVKGDKLVYYTLKNPIRQISIDEYHKCGNIWDMEKCPYTEDFKKQITEGARLVFIYKTGDEFIGEVDLVTKNDDPDYTIEGRRVYLSRLIVKKEYRNKGIGTALTEFLINKAKRMGYAEISLGVNTDNEPAIHLYKKSGFEIIKTDSDENGEFYKMLLRMSNY